MHSDLTQYWWIGVRQSFLHRAKVFNIKKRLCCQSCLKRYLLAFLRLTGVYLILNFLCKVKFIVHNLSFSNAIYRERRSSKIIRQISSLHWPTLVLFFALFIQLSIVPLKSIFMCSGCNFFFRKLFQSTRIYIKGIYLIFLKYVFLHLCTKRASKIIVLPKEMLLSFSIGTFLTNYQVQPNTTEPTQNILHCTKMNKMRDK